MQNIFNSSRKHTVKVEFSDGDHLISDINGSPDSIVGYYIGKMFNLGSVEDRMVRAVKIWFWDGEVFLQHHRIYNVIYSGPCAKVIDHGDQVGLEVHSHNHNGSKYYIGPRRKQLLETINDPLKWNNFIITEFSNCGD